LADGPVGARHRSSSWERGQLFRVWTDLPFEIIYQHEARGFPTATSGLVLAAATRLGIRRQLGIECSR
jgi:hypothetical protein